MPRWPGAPAGPGALLQIGVAPELELEAGDGLPGDLHPGGPALLAHIDRRPVQLVAEGDGAAAPLQLLQADDIEPGLPVEGGGGRLEGRLHEGPGAAHQLPVRGVLAQALDSVAGVLQQVGGGVGHQARLRHPQPLGALLDHHVLPREVGGRLGLEGEAPDQAFEGGAVAAAGGVDGHGIGHGKAAGPGGGGALQQGVGVQGGVGLPALKGKGGPVGGHVLHEPGQPLGQSPGGLGDVVEAALGVDIVEEDLSVGPGGEEQAAGGAGEAPAGGAAAAEPGRQIGQGELPQKIQVDPRHVGGEGLPEGLGGGLHRGGGPGQGVGEGIHQVLEVGVQGGVVVLDAGAALGAEDHHADGPGDAALGPLAHGLASLGLLRPRKKGEEGGEEVLAALVPPGIELGAAQQVEGREGEQDDQGVLAPLDEAALLLIFHGRVPRWAARCGWWCRGPAGPPGR